MGVAVGSSPPPPPPLPPPPPVYPQELQLKLYQAFIFSIPILFSIILFLLFYLFYLKRRASSLSSSHLLPTTSSHSSSPLPCRPDLTVQVQFLDKLPKVFFDEDLRARDSQCCVCLADFEMKEELLQIPYCKHVFHIECIHHWLQSKSNSTCPLCRCSVIPTPTAKSLNPESESPQQATTIIISSSSPLPPHQQHHFS